MVPRRGAHYSYDTEFATTTERRVRQYVGVTIEQGRVTQFAVRLEYRTDSTAGGWETVVQYSHSCKEHDTDTGDVTKAGLCIEIYGGGELIATHTRTPPMPANAALNTAYIRLSESVGAYIERYERWHGIDQDRTPPEEIETLREDLRDQHAKLRDYLAGAGVNVSAWRFARDSD